MGKLTPEAKIRIDKNWRKFSDDELAGLCTDLSHIPVSSEDVKTYRHSGWIPYLRGGESSVCLGFGYVSKFLEFVRYVSSLFDSNKRGSQSDIVYNTRKKADDSDMQPLGDTGPYVNLGKETGTADHSQPAKNHPEEGRPAEACTDYFREEEEEY